MSVRVCAALYLALAVSVFACLAHSMPLSTLLGDRSPEANAESVASLLGYRSSGFQVRAFGVKLRSLLPWLKLDKIAAFFEETSHLPRGH